MKRWEVKARTEVASAYGSASLAMQDSLPSHLKQLVTALGSCELKSKIEIAKTTVAGKDVGKEHGKDRADHSRYSIEEVIREYRLLRQTIIQVLEESIELSAKEREIITDLIEQAVNDAATQFSRSLRERQEHFTAILTHDLRGPITATKGSAQLILRNTDQPEVCAKNANRIIKNLTRMDTMIQSLLDAGRVNMGENLEVVWANCDPNQLAQDVLDEMIHSYGKRFVLKNDSKGDVRWSCDLMRRALENLLTNAVKYGTPDSQITVQLRKKAEAFSLSVHNEGNPIEQSELPKLFQIYQRADSVKQGQQKGWGLGLNMISGVMKAHHGSISVESTDQKGTTFVMNLPVDAEKAGESKSGPLFQT